MPYTARTLITKAYYLSGIVSRDFQSVKGSQITDGLDSLNEALAEESINGALIPYYKEYTFNAVAGQEKYFIPGLIDPETFTFNIGPVRYSLVVKKRGKYFGLQRTDNIQTLPSNWHIERVLNGSDLYLYFLPDRAYPMKLWGKFKLDEVANLDVDLSLVYDMFYLKYLKYSIAEDICEENNFSLPPATAKKLEILQKKLSNVAPMDLSMKKISSLHRNNSVNYGYANFGTGWRPPS
jgi:hypothetical protein